jgi:hypothetical protein
LERAGHPSRHLSHLKDLGLDLDFYLAHDLKKKELSSIRSGVYSIQRECRCRKAEVRYDGWEWAGWRDDLSSAVRRTIAKARRKDSPANFVDFQHGVVDVVGNAPVDAWGRPNP